MVETITPDVCGGRRAKQVALALFAVGAIAAAAAWARLLGARRPPRPDVALAVVAVLALLAAAARGRAGCACRSPSRAQQVPERGRREWPLPVWAWPTAPASAWVPDPPGGRDLLVAAAGALALGDPLVSAPGLAPFGLGRGLMVALPARGAATPPPPSAASPAAAWCAPAAGRDHAWPSWRAPRRRPGAAPGGASGNTTPLPGMAWSPRHRSSPGGPPAVVVRPRRPAGAVRGRALPVADGDLLAYADAAGIRVVNWRTGQEMLRLPAPDGTLTKPALDWPLVAYGSA